MIKCKNDCPEHKYDGCCAECPQGETCENKCEFEPQGCNDAVFEGSDLEVFQSEAAAVIQKISLFLKQKAEIDEAEKELREQLQASMEKHGITSFDADLIKISFVPASTRNSIDSVKLKAQMPDVYEKYTKTSNVKAYVKIELKGDKHEKR